MLSPANAVPHDLRRLGWSAALLGFGLGGFFDGILLHQILQWHHLLSGVLPEETVFDLRAQVLADGIFHIVTYAMTVIGLCLLWRVRGILPAPGARQRVTGAGLLGFGVWHIADAVLFHWIIGLHRIRMEAENLLLWDILWLVPFGLVPAAIGARLLHRPPAEGPRPGGGAAAVSLATTALIAGAAALIPPAGTPGDRTLVVFRPGMDFPAIVAAAEAAGGLPVWSDTGGGVWLIALEPGARPAALYRHGAVLVSNGPLALGCLSWSEPNAV